MSSCLDYKSKELVELAKEVGAESTPAFADKVGTWLDESLIINEYNKEWKDDSTKSNKATSISLKSKPNDKFELVKDLEDNFYSVHFKTSDKKSLSETEKKQLIGEISNRIPIGGKLSTWGNVTKGGISGLNRFKDAGFIDNGEVRKASDENGNEIEIPILTKESYTQIEQQLPTKQQFLDYIESNKPKVAGKVSQPQGLLHAEVLIPVLWKELFDDQHFMNKNGDIDFEKVSDMLPEIMDMLGYRIPNEDKYSTLPLKVIGFLPTNSGGGIMLPAEITTISGSDFDVDKMYVIVKKLIKAKGKLQVEKYLDDKNSTIEERKLAYAGRADKGKAIKNEYKPKLKEVSEQLKELKHIATSIDEIGYELDLLAEELEIANNPTPEDVVIYKLYGKDVTTPEFKKSVEDEIAGYQEQLNKLNERRDIITDNAKSKEVQVLLDKRNKLTAERDSKILETISDKEFNKIPIPQQNTKGARDNEKLDVLMGIYQNPYTAKDIMTPGGYGSIAAIAREFNGDIKPPKDIFGVEAMDNMTIQNIQGRDLKGIAANHNSHASKRQWSKLKLSFPALFDGQKLDSLHDKIAHSVNGEKRTITRNFAEILAASVDNGKDPLLASINYNQHTADVISLLIATGADLKTVFAFINQLVIKHAIELVALGEQRDLMSALKSIAKDRKISTKEADLKITNFNQVDLLSTLKGDKNISNEANVLQSMIKYMAASKDFSNLIAASKSDTKGIGKFMEEGITLMRNIKKALTLKNIQNTEEFLKGNKEEVVEDNTTVKDGVDFVFEQNPELSKIGSANQYSKYINTIFPDSKIKDIIYHGAKKRINNFDKSFIGRGTGINAFGKVFHFTTQRNHAEAYTQDYINDDGDVETFPENIHSVLINVLNTKIITDRESYLIGAGKNPGYENSEYDSISTGLYQERDDIGVFEPEQIHILGSKKDIEGFKQFVKENKSIEKPIDQRFNNMFAKYGVELPINEIMSKIYPYINESFSGIKDVIEQNLGYSMTADEARLVDSMLVQFHSSKFDWYANENKFTIVKGLPAVLQMLKSDYLEFTQSDEVKPLFDALTVGTDDRLGMDIIEFDNTQTASDEQRTDIKKAWQSLSNPYAEQLLTERLLKDDLLTTDELVTLQLDGKSFNNLKAIQGLKKLDKFQDDYSGVNNIKPSGTINVYWGNPESATSTRILSNLAPRKFTYEGREYGSVEHAYQSNKNGKFDEVTYNSYVAKGGYGVKIAPKLTEHGKVGSLQLMKNLVVESFRQNQNSEAAKKLLQYENFTHNTNELIDKAFLEGLKLAQSKLLAKVNSQSVKYDGVSIQKLIQDYLLDRFANNLIRYSFYTTGLNFTPKSISSLIPIGMYTDVKYNGISMSDMVYGIQNIPNSGTRTDFDESGQEITSVDSGSEAEGFIDQFYKHMASNPKFVPKAKFDANDKEGKNNITTIDEKRITIVRKGENLISEDLFTVDKDGYLVPVSNYISIKVDKKDRLYRNVNSGSNNELVFERVNTLGVNGLMYEFDNNSGDKSIVASNNIESTNDNTLIATKDEVEQRKEACK